MPRECDFCGSTLMDNEMRLCKRCVQIKISLDNKQRKLDAFQP